MKQEPQIAVILSTYERPKNLRRALLSIAHQRDAPCLFELVVCDDGSLDETISIVDKFARSVDFPVRMTTHRHDGFQLSRSRNEGVAVSSAPYLLFTDGDCVLPPDHIAKHWELCDKGFVVAGDCYRLDKETSETINDEVIRSGAFVQMTTHAEHTRVSRKALRARVYQMLRLSMRPRLSGINIGLWRADFEKINGFDEQYVGWGMEDCDLQRRLERAGVRTKTILPWTAVYHLWHPTVPSFSRNGEGTENLKYYERDESPVHCVKGLTQHYLNPPTLAPIGELTESKSAVL